MFGARLSKNVLGCYNGITRISSCRYGLFNFGMRCKTTESSTISFDHDPPMVTVPIRFNGQWESIQKGDTSDLAATRKDVILACRRIPHDFDSSFRGRTTYGLDLSIEHRGMLKAETFRNRTKWRQSLGTELESLTLEIPYSTVNQIILFDGAKKEKIAISSNGDTNGVIGMQDGFLFFRLINGDVALTTHIAPSQAAMFRMLLKYSSLAPFIKYPERIWIPNLSKGRTMKQQLSYSSEL